MLLKESLLHLVKKGKTSGCISPVFFFFRMPHPAETMFLLTFRNMRVSRFPFILS